MIWLRPVDRTSGTLTLSAGTPSCLVHHGTPLSKRCPTTTALEHTTVPMDDADRMPPLGAVNPPALWIASKSFCRYGRRKCRVVHRSKIRWPRSGPGQQPLLPHRSVEVRFTTVIGH